MATRQEIERLFFGKKTPGEEFIPGGNVSPDAERAINRGGPLDQSQAPTRFEGRIDKIFGQGPPGFQPAQRFQADQELRTFPGEDRDTGRKIKDTFDARGPDVFPPDRFPIPPEGPPLRIPLGPGTPPNNAADILAKFLTEQGFTPLPFTIGGTSPLDGEINKLISQINSLPPQDPSIKPLSSRLFNLVMARKQQVTDGGDMPIFEFNPDTKQLTPPRDSGDFIGDLGATDLGDRTGPAGETFDADLISRLLSLFESGGVTDEERRIAEGQLISDVQEGSALRREDIANRLASQGVFGGVTQGALSDIFGQAERGLATGLSDIRLGILDRQFQGRQQALQGALELAGLSSLEARETARLLTERELGQARLALDRERLGEELLLNQDRLGLEERGLDQNMIQFLLELLLFADQETRERIENMLLAFGSEI